MKVVLAYGTLDSDGTLSATSREVAAAACELASEMGMRAVGALVGYGVQMAAADFATLGFSQVLCVDDERFARYLGEAFVAAGAATAECVSPSVVLFPHDSQTREWAPLLAARLGGSLVTACVDIICEGRQLVMRKPIYGGGVIGDFAAERYIRMATVLPGFRAPGNRMDPCPIHLVEVKMFNPRTTVVEEVPIETGGGPRLKDARVVVSGGLGVGGSDKWHLIEETAAELGAAVGATRAVTELGWVSVGSQVGFSGTSISPELYIAVGISGAVHHLAGISGANTIVAINNDPEANIFRISRYGAIGDAKEIVPAMNARIRELRGNQAEQQRET